MKLESSESGHTVTSVTQALPNALAWVPKHTGRLNT